jgi:hypothetical protein
MMRDITSVRLLYAKGALFVLCGVLAASALLAEHPTLKTGLLLALAVWCFARAYYFVFYVVERYADPGYRFAGLWSFAWYVLRRGRGVDVQRRESGKERSIRGPENDDDEP